MNADVVISAEGLGKKYFIGHQRQHPRYVALRDALAQSAQNVWRRASDLVRRGAIVPGEEIEEFWALKDVSFEVSQGEVVGIVGRNGAGKSTLLKILGRITEPTEGRVSIRGRVASLLEVGTGFHPELTGRENIYLNGAILGMSGAEIRAKFDEIVAFAEIEKFLDTPVKRYSSGMYVRLAFAVAAHLESEILLVDEILAVGDASFQKKCLGKLETFSQYGRTVLFVSHNMAALSRLCTHGIQFDGGRIKHVGSIDKIIENYLSESRAGTEVLLSSASSKGKNVRVERLAIEQRDSDLLIKIYANVISLQPRIGVGVNVRDRHGQLLAGLAPYKTRLCAENVQGEWRSSMVLHDFFSLFTEGELFLDIWLSDPGLEYLAVIDRAATVRIATNDRYQSGHSFMQSEDGFVVLDATLESIEAAQA